MVYQGELPPELSVQNIAAELQRSGLGQMGQDGQDPIDPDNVVGVVLLLSDIVRRFGGGAVDASGDPVLVAPGAASLRLDEAEATFPEVGIGATEDLTLESPSDREIVRIFDVVGDSPGSDFDVAIFEDQGRTRLNRIYLNTGNNLHFVDRLLEGQDYRDRESGPGEPNKIYVQVTNNDVAIQDITVRVKFRSEPTTF
ncbi:hypothetical protein LCGC14_0595190 [marine sediment metagenome]|uniref:Uncharacterized protein n=1 Tax=marine sediment metagenome TaxID=412755 RepID=A0A0F9RCA3_9ZZZZ